MADTLDCLYILIKKTQLPHSLTSIVICVHLPYAHAAFEFVYLNCCLANIATTIQVELTTNYQECGNRDIDTMAFTGNFSGNGTWHCDRLIVCQNGSDHWLSQGREDSLKQVDARSGDDLCLCHATEDKRHSFCVCLFRICDLQ